MLTDPVDRLVARAAAVGGLVATVVFGWFLWRSGNGFFDATFLGDFHDSQARALFDGRWDAPAEAFPVERIVVDGRFHMYFGPWPSFLRMPVLALTDAVDGGLTRLSLLLAHVVLFAAVVRVAVQVRSLHRDDQPGRVELARIGIFVFAIGSASSVVFMSAAIWVYDEALLWGAAWSLWAISLLVTYATAPTTRLLALVSAVTTLAVLSRMTSGLVPLLVLGAIAALQLLAVVPAEGLQRLGGRLRSLSGLPDALCDRRPTAVILAALVPVIAFSYVNLARFGSILDIPFENQDYLSGNPDRAAVLEQSGGGLVDIRHVPTNVVHYLRPDAVGVEGVFPWVTFGADPTVIGDVARDPQGLSTSLTVSTTALAVLAVIGLGVVFSRRLTSRLDLGAVAQLRLPLLAAVVALGPTLVFPAIAERYKVDGTVILVLAGSVGLAAASALVETRPRARRGVFAALALLLVVNVWVNWSLTTVFQGSYRPFLDPGLRGEQIEERFALADALGLDATPDLIEWEGGGVATLPAPASIGTMAADAECTKVFVSDGRSWLPVTPSDPAGFCAYLE